MYTDEPTWRVKLDVKYYVYKTRHKYDIGILLFYFLS